MNRTSRSASTADVVVATLAILLLAAILLIVIPNIGGTGPSRRNQCSVRLKNLALAAIQHEDTHGHFPGFVQSFGRWDSVDGIDPIDPNADRATLATHHKVGPWTVALLPWLDEQPSYEHWTVDRYPIATGGSDAYPLTKGFQSESKMVGRGYHASISKTLANFVCPDDPLSQAPGENSYICNAGVHHQDRRGQTRWSYERPDGTVVQVDIASSMGAGNGDFNNKLESIDSSGNPIPIGPKVTFADLRDGLSYTALFSESLYAHPWYVAGFSSAEDLVVVPDEPIRWPEGSRYTHSMVWHFADDHDTSVPPVLAIHRINGVPPSTDKMSLRLTQKNAPDLARPSSAHANGVNMSFADGGTRFISESIDYRVYISMLTPDSENSFQPAEETSATLD